MNRFFAALTLSCLVASPAAAQSGVRDSLDDSQILVNKDVGNERWAISYDRAAGTVTGNVFFPDGTEPAFIWCDPQGEPGVIEPGAPDLDLSCYGSDSCLGVPCMPGSWNFIADVSLPVSFFLVDGPRPTPSVNPEPTRTPVPRPTPSAKPQPTPSPTMVPAPTRSPGAPGDVPAERDALFAFLQSRAYESFAAESSVHPTSAPHMSSVRTFLNPLLEQSFLSGAASHPVGAAAIKEMYDRAGTLTAWAAMVKVRSSDGSNGSAWYWYEVFDIETGSPVIDGVGNTTCTGCHARGGTDFVRVPFPLQ